MKLRTALLGAAAGLGATAVGNRLLADRAGPLPPALVGDQHTDRWRGFEVAYATAGDPDDPDVLLLHGLHAAATSQEFDAIFESLAENHHVVAPDLPGFGRTDRPPVTYTAGLYREFVADFAAEHTEDATCIATSLTGAYAASAIEEAGFSRLILVCPTDDAGPRRRWLRGLFRAPVVGQGLFNALVSQPSLEYFDEKEAYSRGADPATVDYQWRTAHQSGARYAPASFIGGYLTPSASLPESLGDADVPVTLVWGREATTTPLATGRTLAEQIDARLVVVDDARLLPHHEHPERFLDAIETALPDA
ncbi:MAG: alpha/beta fold hydrolase [Halobacteriaceae archaeon]